MELIANTTAPRVYTPARIALIAAANAAGRALRALGLRVISEELIPDDSGTPILFVDLRGMPAEYLRDVRSIYAPGRWTHHHAVSGRAPGNQQDEVRHDG